MKREKKPRSIVVRVDITISGRKDSEKQVILLVLPTITTTIHGRFGFDGVLFFFWEPGFEINSVFTKYPSF